MLQVTLVAEFKTGIFPPSIRDREIDDSFRSLAANTGKKENNPVMVVMFRPHEFMQPT